MNTEMDGQKAAVKLFLVAAIGFCIMAPLRLSAADFPTKPVRIVVPFAAGGGTDLIARSVANNLSEVWKQPVVVENRGGGGGRIGAAAVAKGKGDGYSILFGSATVITVAPALHQNLAYDPMKELVPVIEFAYAPQVLSAHPSFPVKSVKDVVQLAKAKPGEVLYSNAGIGSAGHMAMALFESVTQIRLNNISYTGAGPALAALVGGHVNIIFNLLNTTLPQYHAGKINSLGVSSLKRTDLLPKVPTIAESGYPGFETGVWYGLFVPTGTPQPVIRQINKDMLQLMQTPKMQEVLVTTGFAAVGSTPEQFRTKVRAELDTWRRLVKENNIKGE
jgi:tripartite-type tricarboxylate transporter receptor subunit TctC